MELGIAGSLLIFTGIWHAFEWLMDRRNRDTLRLVPFGIAYTALGYCIVNFLGGQIVVWIALILTLIGITAAFMVRKTAEVRGWVMWAYIAIDVAIIAALLAFLISSA